MRTRVLSFCLLLMALLACAPRAHAEGDTVHFFNDIHIPAGSSSHDTVCFFCSVLADGEVNGDLVVFFGNIHLATTAHHDVVSFFSTVSISDNVAIGEDMVSFFDSVHLGRNVSVGQDMVSMFSSIHEASPVTTHGDRVLFSIWLLGGPILVIILIVIVVRELHMRRYPI